jgi:isoquinoline 1-oxidoreductase beta subunit
VSELGTEPGKVMHAASAARWLRRTGQPRHGPAGAGPGRHHPARPQPVPLDRQAGARLDAYDKSTGKAVYSIDVKLDGMLHAAVQHAPRLGMTVGSLRNEDQVKAMKGVHSVHQLPGAVAVVAERWWHAKRAVEAFRWTGRRRRRQQGAADAGGLFQRRLA